MPDAHAAIERGRHLFCNNGDKAVVGAVREYLQAIVEQAGQRYSTTYNRPARGYDTFMSDLLDAARAVARLAGEPITDFSQLPTMETSFHDPRFSALMGPLSKASVDELNHVLDIFVPAVGSADPYQGNRIAIVCGTVIEWGGDAARVASALVQRLPHQLALAARVLPDEADTPFADVFRRDPDGIKAWESLRFLLLASMTALCRVPAARIEARKIPGLKDTLEPFIEYFPEADFLSQLLDYTDGMEIVVLHVSSGKGWRVRLEAINKNFHWFTLLQARIVGDAARGLLPGEPTVPDLLAVARGGAAPTGTLSDFARFHFHTADALQKDGTLSTDAGSWVWGEGVPTDLLPLVGGERVLLLGPPLLGSRSWNEGFFANIHDALRSNVEIVETLSGAQVNDWLGRVRASASTPPGNDIALTKPI